MVETTARVGDEVLFCRDVLLEVARPGVGTVTGVWRLIESGARGRVLGWRDRPGHPPRAVVDVGGTDKRLVVYCAGLLLRRVNDRVDVE
jgi:hypothetical protein